MISFTATAGQDPYGEKCYNNKVYKTKC